MSAGLGARIADAVRAYETALADLTSRSEAATRQIVSTLDIVDAFARAEPVVRRNSFRPDGLYRTNDTPSTDEAVWTWREGGRPRDWVTAEVVAQRLVTWLGPKNALARVERFVDQLLREVQSETEGLVGK